MKKKPFIDLITDIPKPAEPEKAAAGIIEWADSLGKDESNLERWHAIAKNQSASPLLESIFGNSNFLSHCIMRDRSFFQRLLSEDPSGVFAQLVDGINGKVSGIDPIPGGSNLGKVSLPQLMTALRRARERSALLIGLTDIFGIWSLHEITKKLSDFADTAISLAVNWLLINATQQGEIALTNRDHPAKNSGFVILALGKLGSSELNYSSDVDLIALYDQEKAFYTGKKSMHDFFVRMTQNLVQILNERTQDGYVFRTDFRLRPDAGATPIAMSMVAAETYYESVGQNWERAAMIKARAISGDLESGAAFLDRLKPFVWRKNLDFAAIADIQSIKRQIDSKNRTRKFQVTGYNVKLGLGGIREIELFVQTQQLIAGGRDPSLQEPTTCGALDALANSNRITSRARDELTIAYTFLRSVEHRLQMIGDEQTHTIPKDAAGLQHLAIFMGYGSVEKFCEELEAHIGNVRNHCGELFKKSTSLGSHVGNLVFTGTEDDPDTIKSLESMGYQDASAVATAIRQWHHGRFRATRSVRAREILTDIVPRLLTALAKTPMPDSTFSSFESFLSKVPEGVQLFSLFRSNPDLLQLMADIIGMAPYLAELLEHDPHVLDTVLYDNFDDPLPSSELLESDLTPLIVRMRDYQEGLDIPRRWARERRFQVGVHMLRNSLPGYMGMVSLTAVARTVMRALLPVIEADFAESHGTIEASRFAVVGLGSLGSNEMSFRSDLDLIFVYDNPAGITKSNGKKPLETSKYFARLSQKFISAMTATTSEGSLYKIDMRLRPSGQAGPIATSLDGFIRYHQQSAWTWERMALTRARPIAGEQSICMQIEQTIRETLSQPREIGIIVADIRDMRIRLEKEFPGTSIWQLKEIRGGIVDCEFIAQYLQLRYACESKDVLAQRTIDVFSKSAELGFIDPASANELRKHTVFQQNLDALVQICLQKNFDEDRVPEGISMLFTDSMKAPSFSSLCSELKDTHAAVIGFYNRIIC